MRLFPLRDPAPVPRRHDAAGKGVRMMALSNPACGEVP